MKKTKLISFYRGSVVLMLLFVLLGGAATPVQAAVDILVNNPPVANNDSYSTNKDTILNVATVGQLGDGVLANDTDDADSNGLTAVLDTTTTNGVLDLDPFGTFTYTPNANFCGTDSFTYHANDGTLDSNIATVVIDVTCVDNDGPQGMTVTASTFGGTNTSVSAGDTVRDPSVTGLTIEWTDATDVSGVAEYRVGWTGSPTPDLSALTSYSGAGTHTTPVGEASMWFGHVAAIDTLGNVTLQTIGPVFIDAPTTPDYINLDDGQGGIYHGWMESGASQVGADYEATHYSAFGAQKFYATWDTSNLRLAWTGADWNTDGDLFIYFDTAAGGSMTAYNPYVAGVGAAVTLPGSMQADYLISVEDENTASLLSWNGSTWVVDQSLAAPNFFLGPEGGVMTTDLYIPFTSLGLNSGSSLKLVALASEEDTLHVWSAMPDHNPLNSQRSVNSVAIPTLDLPFALTQQFEIYNLGSGVVPSSGQFEDADLHFELTSVPAGVSVGFLQHDLPGLTLPGVALDANLDGVLDMVLPAALNINPVPVASGQLITYMLHYSNNGPANATGVMVSIMAAGGLKDLSITSISIGTIAAGNSGIVVFTAVVDSTLDGESAEVQMKIYDSTHAPFDWLWVQHDIQSNSAPTANTGGPYLGAVNTSIVFDGSGSSDPETDPLTYVWDFGDGSSGSGVMLTHSYTDAGVYTVCLTVNDGDLSSEANCTMAVVYDPSVGFVTGGGWINSPAGALVSNQDAFGKAEFGFVSKYKKGASLPTGNTEFQFEAGEFHFHSTSYQWLVIAGAKAQYKGLGTIEGSSQQYGFILTAIDGSINGGGGVDKFRLKIWNLDSGAVIYDNQMGATDDADPSTAITKGSIVIHKSR